MSWAQRSWAARGAFLGILPAQVKSLQEASLDLSHKAEATESPNSPQKSIQQTEITPCSSSHRPAAHPTSAATALKLLFWAPSCV